MNLNKLIGRRCKLTININGIDLFYTAKIIGVTQSHISFIDKFGDEYTYHINKIQEIKIDSTPKSLNIT